MKNLKLLLITLLISVVGLHAQWTTSGTTTLQSTTSNDVLIGGSSMSGNGLNAVKCFWDYGKRSFRGGFLSAATANNWDNDSLGNISFAFGYNVKATGGYGATALGSFSTASGGNGAMALGYFTRASGLSGATALGRSTIASGNSGATALGYNSVASGNSGATALGYWTTASGSIGATAIGFAAEAAGDKSICVGAGLNSAAKLTNSINESLMVGFNSTAPTLFVGPSAGGSTTGKVGIGNSTPNAKLHVNATEIGEDGLRVQISGSTKMLVHNNGGTSIGGNFSPLANHLSLVAGLQLGNSTETTAGVIRWNGSNFQGYNGTTWQNFENPWVASGVSNVYETDQVGIGAAPSGKLHVTQSTNSSIAAGFKLSTSLGTNEDWYFYMDANDDFTFQNDASSTPALHLQKNTNYVGLGTSNPTHHLHVAGDVAVAGSIVHPSDKRLKTNIENIENGLLLINQLQAKSYNYTKESAVLGLKSQVLQYGLIAQDVKEVLPEIVTEKALIGADGTVYMGLDYEKLIPILVQALKEADAKITALKSDKSALEADVSTLKLDVQELKSNSERLIQFINSQESSK